MNRARASARLVWLLGFRQVRTRPGRALLTVLSVVIGVAGVVAVTTATTATHEAYRNMYDAMLGRAKMEVLSERGGTCPQDLVEQVESLPGVRSAAPLVKRPTSLYFGESRVNALVLGVDPGRNQLVHDFELDSGASLEQEDGAVLDVSFARGAGIRVGDEIKVFIRSGMRRLPVVGLVAPKSMAAASQGGTVWIRLERAQQLFRLDERIDAIHILLKGADEEALLRDVTKLLPPGVVIRRTESRTQMVQDRMLAGQLALNVGCAYVLLAAGFIILNTFLMNVAERRRQLGILRAIGATRNQVTQVLLCEGLLLGAAGTVVGLFAGMGGAWGLMRALEQLFATPLPPPRVSGLSIGLGLLGGLGISLVATFFPARRACRVSPLEGMRRLPSQSAAAGGRIMVQVGGLLVVAGALGMMAALTQRVQSLVAIPSGFAVLIGLTLLIPAVLPQLLRWVAAALAPVLGIEGRIARGQLLRWRVRTSLTVGVVFVVLSTSIGMANSILNNIRDVREWFHQTLSAHFFVRVTAIDMVTGTASEMSETIRGQIQDIRGVQLIDAVRLVRSTANEQPVLVVAREFANYQELPLEIKEGDAAQAPRDLLNGNVVLGSVLARRTGLHAGDEIQLDTDQGPRSLRVTGVATDYQVGGMVLYMERQAARKMLQIEGVDMFLVRADDDAVEHVETQLRELCQREGLILQSFADLSRLIDRIMGGVQAGQWVILALEFLVAGFGIANTLTMNVLEQTREIGLLRVVAMTRRQVRKMVFAQAGMMGLVAVALGLPGGLLLAWMINVCTMPLTGQDIEFVMHPQLLLSGAATALIIVLAAAWFPAERAVRLDPGEALAYE